MWMAAATPLLMVSALLLVSACAGNAAAEGAGAAPDPSESGPAGGALALRVRQMGGFASPAMYATRLPLVSVYDDGRVINEGPQIDIYPAPALPNVQVLQIDPASVRTLVDKAVAAGVRSGVDLGQPPIADATTTRFTVVTAAGEQTMDVVALVEASDNSPGLTPSQHAARKKLAALLEQLSDVPAMLGSAAPNPSKPYTPSAVAAVAAPYQPANDPATSAQPAVPWPGPALPGATVGEGAQLGCVTVTGAAVDGLLSAARSANAMTPWTWGGKQWSVGLRPLLPDEADCAALRAATS